jgi:hypothetical protein
MLKTTLTTIGRILIILAVASVIVVAISAFTSSTAGGTQAQGFDPGFATGAPAFRPERGDGGGGGFGFLEIVKNVGVIGLIVTAYWFIQSWFHQFKHTSHVTV